LHTTIKRIVQKFRLLFCFLLTSKAIAQSILVSPASLNFGIKNELNNDSLSVQISNTGSTEANLKLSIPFRIYGTKPFSIRDSILNLPAGQSKTIWVKCRIKHNTPNPAALIIQSPWQESGGDHYVELKCQGRYSSTYYNASENLEQEALKQSLKSTIGANYNGFSYDVARDKMYGSIDNINDSVTCIYTGRKARFNTRAGAASNNFNCEHTFPQSLFNQDLPMRSDLHHLFSTDDAANNSRGNLPFGIAIPPLVAVSTNAPSKNGGGFYEPRLEQKGATARAMLYFVTRYEDYANYFAPQQAILLKWHRDYPPSQLEKARNQSIFSQQANRNPFVDYPQLADRIQTFTAPSQALPEKKLMVSDSVLYTTESGNSIPENLQLVVWNEGNQAVQLQNIRFLRNYFILNGNSNPVLAANSAISLRFSWNPDSSLQNAGPDSMVFNSNDPARPFVKLSWKKQNQTSIKDVKKNALRIEVMQEENLIRISGEHSPVKQVAILDLTGRQLQLKEISKGLYRIPAWFSGPCFFRVESENQVQCIFHRNPHLYE